MFLGATIAIASLDPKALVQNLRDLTKELIPFPLWRAARCLQVQEHSVRAVVTAATWRWRRRHGDGLLVDRIAFFQKNFIQAGGLREMDNFMGFGFKMPPAGRDVYSRGRGIGAGGCGCRDSAVAARRSGDPLLIAVGRQNYEFPEKLHSSRWFARNG